MKMKKKWNEKPQTVLLKECLDYFREAPVFHRLLTGFREKYMSYGEFSGTVVLFNLTESDVETLEGFFKKIFMDRNRLQFRRFVLKRHWQAADF